jgi:hypothetical protein
VYAMGITVGGTVLARDDATEKRVVTIALSELAFEALTGGKSAVDPSLRIENAVLCYLGDRNVGGAAWAYPGFLRGSETRGEVMTELEVKSDLWRDFEAEATRQGVTVEQLAEHASFYFAAELDAGRVTQRILDDLVSGEDGSSD